MKCQRCGNENSEDVQFCGGCSIPLSASDANGIGICTAELPMVSFPEAIKLGFKNYFKFSGRATRAEFWWWMLFTNLAIIILLIAFHGVADGFGVMYYLFGSVITIPSLALWARRLHDINKSGRWLLLLLSAILLVLPVAVLILWAIKRGDIGPNKYGPDSCQPASQWPYKP